MGLTHKIYVLPLKITLSVAGDLLRNRRKSEKQLQDPPLKKTEANGEKVKRGPGRPPGTTKQNLEQQRLLQQQHQQLANKEAINKDEPSPKKPKIEDEPPKISSELLKHGNPLKWSVQQVCDFVKDLHGCADYVEDFQLQEIDGQALMLLKADHLMSAMQIKLGPALKICSAVSALKEELKLQ